MLDVCLPLGSLALTWVVVSLRRVTGKGGHLFMLGAGEVRISEEAHRSLRRAHAWLAVLAVLFLMLSLLTFVTVAKAPTRSKLTGRLVTTRYARAMACTGLTFLTEALVFFPWYHTLKSASVLVADAVAETRQLIERCSPTSPEWESEVLPSVLKLCDVTLPLLSDGWSDGVGAAFVGSWVIATGVFSVLLESGFPPMAFFTVLFVLMPLGIVYDAAAASSDCDLLVNPLTNKRMKGPTNDIAHEHALRLVELILDRQNTKQGLGFTVGNRVMDLKTLGNIIVGIAGLASTAVPILFSLRPNTISAGVDACSLTTTEIAIFQSTMMARNESCDYNMTVNEVLGM